MKHDQGVEKHYLRSLIGGTIAIAQCGHTVIEPNLWTTIWADVTCGNCLRNRPTWDHVTTDTSE